MLVWVIHTPLKRQNLFGKQMKKGTSSLKKCNNVPSVQHLRTPSCGGPVAPMGSYLQELNTEPVSTFLRRVHMEDHGNILFIAFFVWIDGKGETWQAFFQLQNSRISTRNTTQEGLPLWTVSSAFPKHFHIHCSQPRPKLSGLQARKWKPQVTLQTALDNCGQTAGGTVHGLPFPAGHCTVLLACCPYSEGHCPYSLGLLVS